ncbi:hypothetical protein [Niveispirillum sp.]|uniref:hypothetical protein n=1 Tax=Niveispirillum sp. TaxID=1917217 RepID=UPI001B63753C|nr:hypothetical protein [Niveispirillum sp.]MBP7334765.1 hypothetical protein [Niveispirillum sp.]
MTRLLVLLLLSIVASRSGAKEIAPTPEHCFVEKIYDTAPVMAYVGDRKCLAFEPARVMTGIWINQFEGSIFRENAKIMAEANVSRHNAWLQFDEETQMPDGFKPVAGHGYRLRFIGLIPKAGQSSQYGHLGMWKRMVLVDRVIAWEDLGSFNPCGEARRAAGLCQ